jgi:sulfite reductase beta subunit-like hemoprotein
MSQQQHTLSSHSDSATTDMHLSGLYPQGRDGLYMQRAKVLAGRLLPAQLRALAEIARRFTPDHPLHLTTRQDIELHGINFDDARRVQKKIEAAGLVCTGACGDSVRNITVCPGAGVCPNSRDVAPAADSVRRALENLPFIRNLPRKFKLSFSGCEKACGLPWVNDLGFVLRADGTYLLLGGGSLGPPPRPAMVLSESLSDTELIPAAVAAATLFNQLGDRENRRRARLRHVRERLGDAAFLKQFDEEFRRSLKDSRSAQPISLADRNGFCELTRMSIPSGDLYADEALALASAVEQAEGEIRIDLEHGFWLVTKKPLHLPPNLQHYVNAPAVVSCPGPALCPHALADSRGTARNISEILRTIQEPEIGIKISGCPNSCSHSVVADIGLIGRVRMLHQTCTECYKIVAGGGGGKNSRLAVTLASAVPADQTPQAIEWLIREYQRCRDSGMSFGDFVKAHKGKLQDALAHFSARGPTL